MKTRILSMLLAICLMAGLVLVPAMTVSAASTNKLVMSADVLGVNVNTKDAAILYYGVDGKTPYAWYVIGYNGIGAASSSGEVDETENDQEVTPIPANITLLATTLLGDKTIFREIENPSDATRLPEEANYSGSNLEAVIDAIGRKLSAGEIAAVAKKTLTSGGYFHNSKDGGCGKVTAQCTCVLTDTILGDEVANAVMWPLSLKEASQVDSSLLYIQGQRYWLRSPGSQAGKVCTVDGRDADASKHVITAKAHSYIHYKGAMMSWSVRPAFSLSKDSVLFVSAAVGGKNSSSISAVGNYSDNEWKATVLDSTRNGFSVNTTDINGKVYTVNYSGAKTGSNEYLSVLVKNAAGDITHYGKLRQLTEAAGTITIDLSGISLAETDTIYMINEQINGDKTTDFSSALKEVSLSRTVVAEAVNETAKGANDGKITGVDASMEYRKEGSGEYIAVTGTEITGLAPGKYEVRYKGESKVTVLEILAHVCEFAEGWESDEDGHWHKCTAANCTEQSKEDHKEKTVNKKPATETEAGYTGDTVCRVCDYVISKGKEIPKKGGNTTAPTEPENNPTVPGSNDSDAGSDSLVIIVIVAVVVVAAGAVAAIVIVKKKKAAK